ncbi:hypothetical protein HBI56_042400 [Parastagonospora nodorum]|uniref:Extracellular membrane protein CFEM domain-containing protein n=1 Tax=Phaeosphaeria nodorum (strain SN15 / ATCC MYA-4574 / FGSC 10173) TaxID=321614 RepID=A0A7U2EUE2_PHANO|nr:hypothetical protein HBH56_240700 [Parastagonospora nodorum]QRC93174.1 hypothetical protein JI435_429040 [Parastagonospora nodorum SN15]KAH3932701.1 hypothetical protein HBH54_083740 [Parastagonospora nodorum]KAH3954832.1 hypothetical protein HBH53_010630 [Parastagonospora nodorum]KAH3986356.1 hypothetical protein HBH52_041830 [Parastagonospora nodorum]
MKFTIVIISAILSVAAALPGAHYASTIEKRWECETTPLCAFECTKQRDAFDSCACSLLTCNGGYEWTAKKQALDNCCQEHTT